MFRLASLFGIFRPKTPPTAPARLELMESSGMWEPTVEAFIRSVEFKIDCGYRLMWGCYGRNACCIGWSSPCRMRSAGMVYDSATHVVYEMTARDRANRKASRWIRHGFSRIHDIESVAMGFDPSVAFDDVRFRDVSHSACLLEIRSLFKSRAYSSKSRAPELDRGRGGV